jgi:hypothetical protein
MIHSANSLFSLAMSDPHSKGAEAMRRPTVRMNLMALAGRPLSTKRSVITTAPRLEAVATVIQ